MKRIEVDDLRIEIRTCGNVFIAQVAGMRNRFFGNTEEQAIHRALVSAGRGRRDEAEQAA